jgi:5'-deoxynucleotidase YfbR-like HD superfamily hydrolase
VARWNGQTKGPHAFSVAQHCCLVAEIASHFDPTMTRQARLAALLHDAPEYVIGDMISPFKAALGLDYKAFEHKLLAAIHIRFGLPAKSAAALEKQIKQADRFSAYLEATLLAGFAPAEAEKFFGPSRALEDAPQFRSLEPLAPEAAAARYLKTFKELS